ncbi:MAG: glycosyltransferase [Candidatus Margulisiibacteriota bacterium]
MIKISVVIGTYNQKAVLKKTLESLFHQTLSPELYEIQLIDSSSNDGTDKMIEELKPTCRLNYQRVENKGKTYARNVGIKNAVAELIFITDADIAADPNLLEEHLNAHAKKNNACFEGKEIDSDGSPYIKGWLRPWQKLKWVYFLTGNLSLSKKLLIDAGLFDENFKGYGWEDLELGYRIHNMRIPLYYLPGAINHHNHPVSKEGMVERKYEMGRSAALFYKKHPNLGIKLFLGINPLAMGIFHLFKRFPPLLNLASKNQYLLEEYNYRRGLEEGLAR